MICLTLEQLGPGQTGDGRVKHGMARHLCIIEIDARLMVGTTAPVSRFNSLRNWEISAVEWHETIG